MSSEALPACRSGHLKNGAIVVSGLLQSEDTSAALCLILSASYCGATKDGRHHDAQATNTYFHHRWSVGQTLLDNLFFKKNKEKKHVCLFLFQVPFHPSYYMDSNSAEVLDTQLFIDHFFLKKVLLYI